MGTSYRDYNPEQPKPFIWTTKAADTLEKVKRGRSALTTLQSVWHTTLMAQAIEEDVPILTADETIQRYPAKTIW